jgi:hypothetical protein
VDFDRRVVFVNTKNLSPINAITISILERLEVSVGCESTDNWAGFLNMSFPPETNTG